MTAEKAQHGTWRTSGVESRIGLRRGMGTLRGASRLGTIYAVGILAAVSAAGAGLSAQGILRSGPLPDGLSTCELPAPQVPPGQPASPALVGTALCGSLVVPEDWSKPNGRKLSLQVVVVPALKQSAQPDPLLWMNGGPGFATTPAAAGIGARFQEFLPDRDMVFIDQRGTRGSGDLFCLQEFLDPEAPLQMLLGRAFPPDPMMTCLRTLEEDHDLSQYTTSATVRDLDAVRDWLGYETWNFWGLSYGSRLGQAYLKEYPERVRTLVLDAVVPLDYGMPNPFPAGVETALEAALTACEMDTDCSTAYPELRGDLSVLAETLEKGPTVARVADPRPGHDNMVDVLVGGGDVALVLRSMLYGGGVANLPNAVTTAAAGDWTPFVQTAVRTAMGRAAGAAVGLYASVLCSEDLPIVSYTDARRNAAGTMSGLGGFRELKTICGFWPSQPAPLDFYDPARSGAPVLLFSGEFDPGTPPAAGAAVARHLEDALHIVVPFGGHGSGSHRAARDCTHGILAAFVRAGRLEGLDTSCLKTIGPPIFTQGR